MRNFEDQVSQLAIAIGKLEAQGSGKLLSQTTVNPRENVTVIEKREATLRTGTH